MYINFCFKNLEYDDHYYAGSFEAPDNNISCRFYYDRETGECRLYDANKSEEAILPLPIWWLDKKLKENGMLRETEYRTCY